MNLSIPISTWSWLIAITVTFLGCVCCVFYFKRSDKLIANRRMVEYFPTFVSTLGVLGTFYGITIGLLAFDTSDLDNSIPRLLDGLKTAFFTSLAGMIGSMILSAFISRKQDERDGGVSDINQAASTICQAVQRMSSLNAEAIGALKRQMAEQEADRKAFYRTMGDVMDSVKESELAIVETLANINNSQSAATSALDSIAILQRSQEGTLTSIKESTLSQTAILEDVKRSMDKTTSLFERKFDEFAELLKKSNTEALVEVMKKVTEEFQKQMNALINKLIQENFDQLNKSVERLNQWQQENKDMIASLTRQYKEMATNFEATSTSLDRVKDDTQSLVSEGGKLRQIVDALNQVIVNDDRFIKTAEHLQKTAELSQTNMESFDESTKALNGWVRKQRNFVDGVTLLIEKLEEISKIKDYNEQFWAGTKRSLEEGVGLLNRTSQTIRTSLTDIDRQFYNRLNATLAELDTCIQAMIKGR